MSSYVYKKAIRYKLPKDKVDIIKKQEIDYYDDDFAKAIGLPEELEVDSAYSDNGLEIYIDKVGEKLFDEISGDFANARMLSDEEINHHLPIFQKFDSDIKGSDLRAVEFCYYNGVDAPPCYDVTEDNDWLF